MSIGLWGHASGEIASPAPAEDGTDHADLPEWTKRDQQAMGSILLCVTPSIQQDLQSELDSECYEYTTFIPFTDRTPTGPIANPEGGRSPNPPNERWTGSRTL